MGTVAWSLPHQPAASTCHEKCYDGKSRAYQRCRAIPPTDRAQRTECFRKADAALERCLAACR